MSPPLLDTALKKSARGFLEFLIYLAEVSGRIIDRHPDRPRLATSRQILGRARGYSHGVSWRGAWGGGVGDSVGVGSCNAGECFDQSVKSDIFLAIGEGAVPK